MFEQQVPIIFNRPVAADTFLMGIVSPQIVAESHPGQFVMIGFHDAMDPLLRRPFSICGTQGEDILLILYRIAGRGTAIMSGMGKGETLSVLAPLGKGFEVRKSTDYHLMVGGGIGIAPLIYLAQITDANMGRILMGYRSSNEVIPMEPFKLKHTDIVIATDDGSKGHSGLVTELLTYQLNQVKGTDPVVYACGPHAMLQEVVTITQHHQIPCQISIEAHMACGLGVCQGCAVPATNKEKSSYYHVCQDGPVFWSDVIDLSCPEQGRRDGSGGHTCADPPMRVP